MTNTAKLTRVDIISAGPVHRLPGVDPVYWPLNDEGVRNAFYIAGNYGGERIEGVYCSDTIAATTVCGGIMQHVMDPHVGLSRRSDFFSDVHLGTMLDVAIAYETREFDLVKPYLSDNPGQDFRLRHHGKTMRGSILSGGRMVFDKSLFVICTGFRLFDAILAFELSKSGFDLGGEHGTTTQRTEPDKALLSLRIPEGCRARLTFKDGMYQSFQIDSLRPPAKAAA